MMGATGLAESADVTNQRGAKRVGEGESHTTSAAFSDHGFFARYFTVHTPSC